MMARAASRCSLSRLPRVPPRSLLLHAPRRQLATRAPRSCEWSAIPAAERGAWEALGWTAESWHGAKAAPLSALQRWNELSNSEQAAAAHGLEYTPHEWDAHVDDLASSGSVISRDSTGHGNAAAPSSTTNGGEVSSGSSISTLAVKSVASAILGTARLLAPVLPVIGRALQQSKGVGAASAGHALSNAASFQDSFAPPVEIEEVETTLYLDDSGSMGLPRKRRTHERGFLTTYLDEAKKALAALTPLLTGPTRVLKFGDLPTVLHARDGSLDRTSRALAVASFLTPATLSPLLLSWDASSGGTYMWHMIQQDVLSRYVPGGGKLRLIVLTDGLDVRSPPEYQGIAGMHPMQRTLQREGYDIEWHIVVLGEVDGSKAYAALAGATGGSFVQIEDVFDVQQPSVRHFLGSIERGGDAAARRTRQQQYSLEASKGQAERVPWFRALPPPGK